MVRKNKGKSDEVEKRSNETKRKHETPHLLKTKNQSK